MTEILPPLIVGVVCTLVGWILGYWNGSRTQAERWDHRLQDLRAEE